jgi:hypothetical protein
VKHRILLGFFGLVGLCLAAFYAVGVFGVDPAKVDTAASRLSGGYVESRFGPAEPDDWFIAQRAGGPGKTLDDAAAGKAAIKAKDIRGNAANRRFHGTWELAGPTNVGGRIVDLAVDPVNENTIYVATATGGVWKSTDGVVRMEKAWPDDYAQSMGAIAAAPDGTLWAGTGEHNPGGGSITFGGNGVYRSTDGGERWKHMGLANSGTTGRIWVDPSDSQTIFAAMSGSLFNPGGERGIYRSTDNGRHWKLVLAPETPFTGGIDLAIHPSNPDRIYAAMWDHRREPDLRTYGGLGSGLFRSDDGGDTWKRLDNVLTFSPGDTSGLSKSETLGRIGVAIAPTNPNRIYVITTATFGQDKGFYVSNDGGESFNAQTRPGSQGGFGWWFGRLWVDPTNQDVVWAAGVNMRRSLNGGATWGNVGGLHADQHAMGWNDSVPGDDAITPTKAYIGNDGGTYKAEVTQPTPGTFVTGPFVQAQYEPYTQFYSVDVGEQFPERITGGAQDNGCLRSWDFDLANPDEINGGPDNWNSFGCGDGEYTLINPDNNDLFYGCSQYGSCSRSYDNPTQVPPLFTNASMSPRSRSTTPVPLPSRQWLSNRRNWYTPVVFDPSNSATMYIAGEVVNKSVDNGFTWTPISDGVDLTGTFESPDRVDPFYPNWGTVTTISVAKTAPDTIYVGTDTGRLWKTENGGGTWTEFVGKGLPERWVTRVAVDPRDSKTVWATFSGFRNGEDAAHVYKTTDGGETWVNNSGNLPNAPVNDVVIDTERDTVYIGSDVGVYNLKRGGNHWQFVGKGFPLAPVLDIRLHGPSDTLYASTFGRAMWRIDLTD